MQIYVVGSQIVLEIDGQQLIYTPRKNISADELETLLMMTLANLEQYF